MNLVSGSDIALYFEVRFDYGTDKKAIITNKRQNGHWGIEKKEFFVFHFPFPVNQTFDMAIKVEWNVFKVSLFVSADQYLFCFILLSLVILVSNLTYTEKNVIILARQYLTTLAIFPKK